MQNSITKNYIYNLFYQLVAVISPLITTPYISRVLGANSIGIYSYTFSIVSYFSIFAALGINTYGKLKIAENRNNIKKTSKIFLEIFFARVITVVVCLLFYCILAIIMHEYTEILMILSLNIIAVSLDITWFFHGLELFRITVLKSILIKLIGVFAIFLFVKNKDDLYLYALILQLSNFIGFFILWVNLKNYIVKVPFKNLEISVHWKNCFIYFIPTLAGTLYSYVDKTMIGVLIESNDENGYYEEALKIEQVILNIVTSLSTVILPRMAFLFKENQKSEIQKITEKSFRFTMCFSLSCMAGLLSISDILIPLYLGNDFERSIVLLKIFSVLLLISGIKTNLGQTIIMPSGQQKKYNLGVVVGTIINILANLRLIPIYGGVGAAIASIISELVVVAFFLYFSKQYVTFGSIIKVSWKYIIASTLMFITVRSINHVWQGISVTKLVVLIINGVVCFCIVLVIFKDPIVNEGKLMFYNKLKKR